jgi:hypothetical protein
MTQMQTLETDGSVLRIFITKSQSKGLVEVKQRVVIQGRVKKGQNGRQAQGR